MAIEIPMDMDDQDFAQWIIGLVARINAERPQRDAELDAIFAEMETARRTKEAVAGSMGPETRHIDNLLGVIDNRVIVCPVCLMASWHPKDVEYGYCGNCHDFTSIGSADLAILKVVAARRGRDFGA